MSSLICHECNSEFLNAQKLALHIFNAHKLKAQDYYSRHFRPGCCDVCKGPTKFLSISAGYDTICGHSCGAKAFRKELKADKHRYSQFQARIADAQTKVWKDRSDDVKRIIYAKMSSNWSPPCPSKSSSQADLERISINDAKMWNITLRGDESAFQQVQQVVERNLCALLNING